MKLQTFKNLVKDNFPQKYYDLIDTLGFSINPVMTQLLNAMNRNLTVTDNLNMQYKDIVVTVDANGTPTTTTTYKSTLNGSTQGIVVIRADNLTSSRTYPVSYPFISWIDNSGTVTINNISGLQANQKYQLRILATA